MADWQQFYVPSTVQFGETRASVDAENAEKQRQAMLMAEQINQASQTTQYMDTQNKLASGMVMNEYGGWVPASTVKSGGYSSPSSSSISSGSYTQPSGGTSTGSGSYLYPTSVSVTSYPSGGANPLSSQLQQQYDPWSQYRGQAGTELAGTIGAESPSNIYQQKLASMASGEFTPDDPSYQFRFKQGQQAAERSLASRGLLNSGNAALELQQYGQGMASQEYGAQFNRMLQGLSGTEDAYNNQINRLMQMAGVNLDPTSGGQLAVQQGQLGVQQGQLGINAQTIANQYDLGMRELVLKQQLASQAQARQGVGGMTGTDWSSVFGGR